MLSAKENLLTCLRGEMPEWVPRYTMGLGENPSDIMIEPSVISMHRKGGDGKDIWGVRYVPTESTGNALIPDNSTFILDDIRHWHDVIKKPDLSGIDWEKMAKDDLAERKVNREITAVSCNLHIGYFQNLMAFMGFTNGLMAFYEEPEEVHALFEYLCDFYCEVSEKYIDHIKPDVWGLVDDTAAWNNPFISPAMYREFLIPCYDRQAKFARDRGLPISMHNCGKAEGFIDDLVSIGVCAWDPAQTCNDLLAVKAKHGRKLVICGGWDARDDLLKEDLTYEEIYASLKASFDKLAPGGGYCFCGGFLGRLGDEKTLQKNRMVRRAAEELGHLYY